MPDLPPTFRPPHLGPKRDARERAERRRGSARARGYSPAWDRYSKRRMREQPLCIGCLAAGFTVPATVTDHVVPHDGDKTLFWDRSNHQSACGTLCHSRVKQILETRWRRGELSAGDLRLDSAAAQAVRQSLTGQG